MHKIFKVHCILLIIINFYIGFHATIDPLNILAGIVLLWSTIYYKL